MKITFVNIRREMYPPLGLCYLSSYIKQNMVGIETALVELVYKENRKAAMRKILATRPQVVGFTTYTVGYHEVISLCDSLKKLHPDLMIWLGGPHITSLPQTLPSGADIGVIGEGEETVLDLCRNFIAQGHIGEKELSGIKGICYRRDGRVFVEPKRELISPLDAVPFPDISLLDMQWYTKSKRFLIIEEYFKGFVLLTSRGCPYNCRFCQAAVQWGKCRYHSAQRVVSEIENLRINYPHINAINIIDDLFIADRRRLAETVKLLRERHLHKDIAFNVNGRANLIDREILEMLKSINVVQISYGFESGSERILNFLKKGSVSMHHNHTAAELTNSYGIGVGGQFMVGTPGETEGEIGATINFIKTHKMSHAHLSVTCPLPGTELWNLCKVKGLVSENMDWRVVDFGNPDNTNIIYCNEDAVPYERFRVLLREAQEACAQWTPPPTLREYLSYMEVLSPAEFFRKAVRRILSFPRYITRKLRQSQGQT